MKLKDKLAEGYASEWAESHLHAARMGFLIGFEKARELIDKEYHKEDGTYRKEPLEVGEEEV